jgi:hypothetical protein
MWASTRDLGHQAARAELHPLTGPLGATRAAWTRRTRLQRILTRTQVAGAESEDMAATGPEGRGSKGVRGS